jgi:hypothetical protein
MGMDQELPSKCESPEFKLQYCPKNCGVVVVVVVVSWLFLRQGLNYATHAGLKLKILLSLLPKCWG